MNRLSKVAIVAGLAVTGAACSIDLGTADRLPTFLETEWQGSTSDTVAALIQGVVVAQVIDQDGRPMTGRFITFTALPLDGKASMLLAPEGFVPTEPSTRVLSDFGGISVAQVRLGSVAGRGAVEVSVFELDTKDTLYVDILPGQLSQVVLTPGDTTIQAGGSFVLNWQPADVFANPVEAEVELLATGAVSVVRDGDSATVTGDAAGTGVVSAIAGTVRDSIVVQVSGSNQRR